MNHEIAHRLRIEGTMPKGSNLLLSFHDIDNVVASLIQTKPTDSGFDVIIEVIGIAKFNRDEILKTLAEGGMNITESVNNPGEGSVLAVEREFY